MSIHNFQFQFIGEDGVTPRLCRISTNDSLATITATGYLDSLILQGNPVYPTDFFFINYGTAGTTSGIFTPSFSGGVCTLNAYESTGNVTLPVVSGDFAVFNGTAGVIKDAGYSASNAAKTKVVMANAAVTVNHLASFVDTAGTVQDSGVLTSAVQLNTNIKAGHTINIGGGGAGPITVNLTGVTSSSVIVGTIISSSNAVQIQTIAPGSGTFAVTFSGDPGASAIVSYVAFLAAQ